MKLTISNYIRDILLQIETRASSLKDGELRAALKETPSRVEKAWGEMLNGYDIDINSLFKTFDGEGKDQIVAVTNINDYSICEHHLLPFFIDASVIYLPKDKVIGVSKMERLVRAYSHRLQLQERLTEQVATALMTHLQPEGAACIIRGQHLCMRARGVKSASSQVVTSVMLGKFRDDSALRAEVISLV